MRLRYGIEPARPRNSLQVRPYGLGSGGPAYAARAVEILLDAIARSDRSRGS